MKLKMRTAAALAAVACGIGAPLVVAQPAAAATPTCNLALNHQNRAVPGTDIGGLSPNCLMSYGANSQAVRTLQFNLNQCYSKSLATDGQFGTNTRNALRDVQDRLNIGVDGKYGPQTARAMNHRSFIGRPCGRITF